MALLYNQFLRAKKPVYLGGNLGSECSFRSRFAHSFILFTSELGRRRPSSQLSSTRCYRVRLAFFIVRLCRRFCLFGLVGDSIFSVFYGFNLIVYRACSLIVYRACLYSGRPVKGRVAGTAVVYRGRWTVASSCFRSTRPSSRSAARLSVSSTYIRDISELVLLVDGAKGRVKI